MAATTLSPLYEKIYSRYPLHRALDITVLFLLISILWYRISTLQHHGFLWLVAFLCESFFTFIWILTVNAKWNPLDYKTYPKRIPQRMEERLPAVDMFVTTADSVLEPPIMTMNTVLSLLAVDYPADKLACYLSDDGCSPLTFYSLRLTSEFAKLWVPFCNKYNLKVRAPFRYFSSTDDAILVGHKSRAFQQEWTNLKDEYEKLSSKIQEAAEGSIPDNLQEFLKIDRRNHPTIIKIIWENKEGLSDGVPHLIYISREKRPKHPHHYKAGAMNVLTRVSGTMTNAPFMLNVDCDMFANNPQIVRHAMCLFLGCQREGDCGFVQTPQYFYDGLKDDPFGNQLKVLHHYLGRGIVGLQGPFYGGTGCFHRRKVIYGLCPNDVHDEHKTLTPVTGELDDKEMIKIFGQSKQFVETVRDALLEKTNGERNVSDKVETAHEVAACGYEYETAFGIQVGWQYGSTTEDVLTGLKIHSRGWRSAYCNPNPKAFLGCSPSSGPNSMVQQKRWATGLLEIMVSKKGPIHATLWAKLQLRQCLAYMWIHAWGLRSAPELCYLALPAFSIFSHSHFLPKVDEAAIYNFIALLVVYNFYTILEYIRSGLSIREWWNNQKMARINTTGPWLFGFASVILKILGISEMKFEVTQKDQSSSSDDSYVGEFTFDGSPMFLPGTTLLMLQLTALIMGLMSRNGGLGSILGEMLCCLMVLMLFSPFLKGLIRKGKYGIPLITILKSGILTLCFVIICKHLGFVN